MQYIGVPIGNDLVISVYGSDDQENWSILDNKQVSKGETLLLRDGNLLFSPHRSHEIMFPYPVSKRYIKLEMSKKFKKVFKFNIVKDA